MWCYLSRLCPADEAISVSQSLKKTLFFYCLLTLGCGPTSIKYETKDDLSQKVFVTSFVNLKDLDLGEVVGVLGSNYFRDQLCRPWWGEASPTSSAVGH